MMYFRYSGTTSMVPRGLILAFAVGLALYLGAHRARAQETTGPGQKAQTEPTAEGGTPGQAAAGDGDRAAGKGAQAKASPAGAVAPEEETPSDYERRMAEMEEHIRVLDEKSEADTRKIEQLSERLDVQEEEALKRIEGEHKKLKIYGFLDVQWYRFVLPKNSFYDGFVNDNNTFMVGRWNMFVERYLGDHFRVLGEVRFLFQPYGEVLSYGNPMGAEYERMNTAATDWADAYYFDWGGISIERAWVEYKLNDHFGAKVGHFLTPFGLWNEDHAFTVVIPARRPFLITSRMLPESQTGLYFYGRAFPSDTMLIDYGLTLTNGRGPAAEFYDLDENKAVGLKLRFAYDGPVKLELGTYLIMGDYTDMASSIVTYVPIVDYQFDKTLWYSEKAMSVHLKFEWQGLLLQGEYVRGMIRFKDGHRVNTSYTGGEEYAPDYVQDSAYALAIYRLPLKAVDIGPYVIYQYTNPTTWARLPMGHGVGGGINWRLIPEVIWKVEYNYLNGKGDDGGLPSRDYGLVITQLAVSY
jgi:hypothetical protein